MWPAFFVDTGWDRRTPGSPQRPFQDVAQDSHLLGGRVLTRWTSVPSVLGGEMEGAVRGEDAQGLLIRTKSLMCCRECFMVLEV